MSGTVEDALDTALRALPPRPHRTITVGPPLGRHHRHTEPISSPAKGPTILDNTLGKE